MVVRDKGYIAEKLHDDVRSNSHGSHTEVSFLTGHGARLHGYSAAVARIQPILSLCSYATRVHRLECGQRNISLEQMACPLTTLCLEGWLGTSE